MNNLKRDCGDCDACCRTLEYEIFGKTYHKGNPCIYLKKEGSGCSIYDKRPEVCRNFRCLWLDDFSIPDYMRPDKSQMLLTQRSYKDEYYLCAEEIGGGKVSAKILSQIIQYAFHTNQNLEYRIDNGVYWLGSPKFMNAMQIRLIDAKENSKLQLEKKS